jgi:F-type H+-transporting ATPase subunit epsilon
VADTLEVHLVTPEREVWVGQASIVIARAIDGDVGILPGHAPMVAALAVGPLFIGTEGEGREAYVVDGGFVHVGADGSRVDVLAEHAERSEEIDAAEIRRFEQRAAELRDAQHFEEARAAAAKALTRQRLGG